MACNYLKTKWFFVLCVNVETFDSVIRYVGKSNLFPMGRDSFGQHKESGPAFISSLSLCACSEIIFVEKRARSINRLKRAGFGDKMAKTF